MVGREFVGDTVAGYRFGFNGKEGDNGTQTQDYGMRIYDSRLGRFLSVDPITRDYPMLTPYQFASNTPIAAIDLDGLECFIVSKLYITTRLGHSIPFKAYYREVRMSNRANKTIPNSDFTCLILIGNQDISNINQNDLERIAVAHIDEIRLTNATETSYRQGLLSIQIHCLTNVGEQKGLASLAINKKITFGYKAGQTKEDVKSTIEGSASSLQQIDDIAAILVNNPDAKINITGTASQRGILNNENIASNRAAAGKAFLLDYIRDNYAGATIDESRISTSSKVSTAARDDKGNQAIEFKLNTASPPN